MAELTINAEDVRNALNEFAASYEPAMQNVLRWVELYRPPTVSLVSRPSSVMANELLLFRRRHPRPRTEPDTRNIGVIVLGDLPVLKRARSYTALVRSSRCLLATAYLGRVVDPLGNPIDDLGPIESGRSPRTGAAGSGVTQRKSVHEPLQTGLKRNRLDDSDRPRSASTSLVTARPVRPLSRSTPF